MSRGSTKPGRIEKETLETALRHVLVVCLHIVIARISFVSVFAIQLPSAAYEREFYGNCILHLQT